MDSTVRWTASVRNTALKAARYDIVAMLDADCEAPRNWLATLAHQFKKAKNDDDRVIGVGGANRAPENSSNFVKAIETASDSYVGSFSSVQGRRFKQRVYVSSLATLNALYEKGPLETVGFFDESLRHEAEDADLNHRLVAKGHKMCYVPESYVWHKMRATPIGWFKNMFRYGKGRARLLKRYPGMWSPAYLLPLLFLAAMAAMAAGPIWSGFYLGLCYFPVLFLYAMWQCIHKKSLFLTGHVFGVYLLSHFGYSFGELYGLINPRVK